jgi:3-hydroxybutyryl-CoA dehydrogenase
MTQLENRPIAESPNHSMSTVGVVGAGTMGHGIAQVMVRAGHRVLLLDISQDFVEAGAKKVAKGLARDVEKARMTAEEREHALARLRATTVVAELAAADFIIEAVAEKLVIWDRP